MAKVTAPNLSIGSRGQVGKTLVSSVWRGVNYVRRYVIPANPGTAGQTTTRDTFSFLSNAWKLMDAAAQAVWTAYAKGKPLTNRNAFIQANLHGFRGAHSLASWVGSPGSNGGYACPSFTASAGTGTVTAAPDAPDVPSDWSVTKLHVVAIADQDTAPTPPATWAQKPATYYGSDDSAEYSVALTVPAGKYYIAAWFEFTKPDGSTAYGTSYTSNATATS